MTSPSAILAILPLLFAPASFQDAKPDDATTLSNLDQSALQLAMARLATDHPDLVTVVAIGESRQKRRIEALRIAAGAPAPGRPAMLLVANVDGPLAWTSSLAVRHAQDLARRYATDARVKALLDRTTIWIVPRANPDAAQARFETPLREQRASGPGVDDDRDGRMGEDPPSDVDGDGWITWMRVPDPEGEWTTDPADPRALVKADRARGQRGTWKLVREGRDSDRDTVASEDAELDVDVNRNFPQGWSEHAVDAGRFPTDEPETRALCDFVVQHREIALVWTYGEVDDVMEKPRVEAKRPRQSANPSAGMPEADVAIYAELGRRFQAVASASKGTSPDGGTFQAWIAAQRGLWTIDVAPWSIPLDTAAPNKDAPNKDTSNKDAKTDDASADAAKNDTPKNEAANKDAAKSDGSGKDGAKSDAPTKGKGATSSKKDDEPSDDAKRLRWIDAHADVARFVPWKPFQHPELGAVEIGGFAPYARIEPPPAERAEIARKNVEFLLELGELLPRVRVVDARAHDLAGGLWEVKAAIENASMLPYPSALGERTGNVRALRVSLTLPKGAQLLAGRNVELVESLNGSGGRHEFRWLVRGAAPSDMRVSIDSDSAGAHETAVEVK